MADFAKPPPKFPNKFLKKNPYYLKAKQLKKDELEEEEYFDKMGEIIKRDFFPDLKKIQNIYKTGETASMINKRNNEEEEKLSLNEFLRKFNSEDNKSFNKLIEKDQEAWREKFWWIYKGEEDQRKLKALQDDAEISENRKKHMLKNEPLLKICDVNGVTNLIFMPTSHDGKLASLGPNEEPDFRKVLPENTRMENPTSNYIDSMTLSSQKLANLNYGQMGGLYTPDLIGYKRRDELQSEGPLNLSKLQAGEGNSPVKGQKVGEINGFKLLTLPSPSPSEMKSPLITWGEIMIAPKRVESDPNSGYRIPAKPRKEILGVKLIDYLTKKKKISKKSQETKIKNLITPSRIGTNSSMNSSALKRISSIRSSESSASSLLIKQISKDKMKNLMLNYKRKGNTSTPSSVSSKTESLLKK